MLSFIVAPISGRLLQRLPARAIMGTGMILVGVGLMLMHGIDVDDDWTTLLVGSLVAGVGIGLTNPGIASVAIGVVDAARAGMASGINSTFRQVGIATGMAALGAVFQTRIESKLGELLPQAPRGARPLLRGGLLGRRAGRAGRRLRPRFATRPPTPPTRRSSEP